MSGTPTIPTSIPSRSPSAISVFAGFLSIALAIYWPALHGPFFWDDDELVYQNPDVVNPSGLIHAWRNATSPDYTPIATNSYWLEWGFWQRSTLGYHLDNVVLHALNATLIWLILEGLNMPGALAAATLFLIHPVCVESVAWISERRNTLSMAFYLLTALWFLHFLKTGSKRNYCAAVLLFVAAVLTKGSVVILPPVLLLMAWWVRGRWLRADALRTLPFFALSVLMSGVTLWFQQRRAMGHIDLSDFTFPRRLSIAVQSVFFYAGKALLPFDLCLIYPRFGRLPFWTAAVLAAALAGLGFFLYKSRAVWARASFLAMSYFVIALLPVTGLVKMAYMQHGEAADHFAYLALIAPLALGAAAVSLRMRLASHSGRYLYIAATLLLGIALTGYARVRASYFGQPDQLWALTARQNPEAWTAHEHIAISLYESQRFPAAEAEFRRSLQLHPSNYRAWFNLGVVLRIQSRCNEAIPAYRRAIELRTDLIAALRGIQDCGRVKP